MGCNKGIALNKIKYVLFLFLLFSAVGCSDGTEAREPPDVDAACAQTIDNCPTDYIWSNFFTTEWGCRQFFNCSLEEIYNYGEDCADTLRSGINCLTTATGSYRCDFCEDRFFLELDLNCHFPPPECW